jgi:hypothetical protein
MQQKTKISIAVFTVLILGVLATNLVLGANSNAYTTSLCIDETAMELEVSEDIEALVRMIPKTLEEAEAEIVPLRARYLMWTHDGVHIMWGFCGNGRFTGNDNSGKHCWGIYGKGVFAGFYNGEFFWGRYRNGTWKAQDLFKPGPTHGKYVLFPIVVPLAATESLP